MGVSFYCQARNSSLEIEKRTNGVDADEPNQADIPLIAPGRPITWTYLVRNVGTEVVVLSDVKVTDSQPGILPQFDPSSDQEGDGLLSPGEVWTFVAASVAQYLHIPNPNIDVVEGCQGAATPATKYAYQNRGMVSLGSMTDTDGQPLL